MPDFRWDLRDILRAPRHAIDVASIWAGALTVLCMALILTLATYIGILLDGRFPIRYVWEEFHLLPWLYDLQLNAAGSFAVTAGEVAAFAVFLYGLVAVSKIAYRRLKDDHTYGTGDAWRFAGARGHAPLTILSLVMAGGLSVFLIGLLVSFIGRLPWAGEILLALAVAPMLVLGLAAIAGAALGTGTLLLGPAVVGALDDDWLDVLIHVGAILWGQWWRWLFYEVLVVGTTVFAGIVVFGLLAGGLAISLALCGLLVPGKMLGMVLVAANIVPGVGALVLRLLSAQFGGVFTVTPTVVFAGIILTALLVALAALVLGYLVSVWATGQMLAYAILRKRQLRQNIFEREDDLDRRNAIAAMSKRRTDSAAEQPHETASKGGAQDAQELIQIEKKQEEASDGGVAS